MWPNPRVPYELSSNRKKLSPPDGKPLIVHVRSLNYRNNKSLKSNLHLKILKKFADIILAIDQDVLKTINIKNKTIILRNILDLKVKNKKTKNLTKELTPVLSICLICEIISLLLKNTYLILL